MTILAHLRTLAIASIRRLAIKEESMAPCAGALGNVNGPLVVTGIRTAYGRSARFGLGSLPQQPGPRR